MCVLRVFAVIIFTMVMLFRIDWDVYMRGLEGWDTGTYVFTVQEVVGVMYVLSPLAGSFVGRIWLRPDIQKPVQWNLLYGRHHLSQYFVLYSEGSLTWGVSSGRGTV